MPAVWQHPELGRIDLFWGKPGNPKKNFDGGYGLSTQRQSFIRTRAIRLRNRLNGNGDAFECWFSDEDFDDYFDEELGDDDLDEELRDADFDSNGEDIAGSS